jgi:hypothetical protein
MKRNISCRILFKNELWNGKQFWAHMRLIYSWNWGNFSRGELCCWVWNTDLCITRVSWNLWLSRGALQSQGPTVRTEVATSSSFISFRFNVFRNTLSPNTCNLTFSTGWDTMFHNRKKQQATLSLWLRLHEVSITWELAPLSFRRECELCITK